MKNRFNRNYILASVIATTLGAGFATSAYSQSADATLRGKATAGAEVTAKNLANGSVRHTATAGDGTYVLVGLTPGMYRVDVGPGTERVVTVSVATTSVLDFTGGEPSVAPETTLADITVKSSKLVEVRTSEVGRVVSLDQIATVPQLTRNFLEFADTVPGIVFNVDSHGKTSIRGGAQNDNSVNVYIDGVGQKGYVRSGLSGQTDNTQGNPFPQLAIGEYKVITSNYKAEYDQISSAAVTAETKSGTNEFHGEVFGTYTNQSMRAETPAELGAGGIKTDSKTKEFGASVGGPIIQDQLHFFIAYEGKRYTTPSTVTLDGGVPANIASQLPQNILNQLGPVTIPFTENLYFGKLDWEPTSDDRIALDAKIRTEDSLGSQAGTGTAASASLATHNTDNRWALRWEHSSQNWFNEALFTYEDSFFQPMPVSGTTNGATYTFGSNNAGIITADGVDPRAGQNKGQRGWAIGDTVTWSHLNFISGDHTVKAGVKYKAVKLTAMDAVLDSPPMFFYDVSASGTATDPYKATFAASAPNLAGIAVSDDRQLGMFLQDDWAVDNKLTLNLGMRWDIEWNPSYLDFKTPQALLDSFNTVVDPATGHTYGQTLGLSSDPNVNININDYISTGNNRKAFKGEFQPRIGFSYDLFEDQKHVVFGGIGRAYDRNLYDYLQLEITKIALSEPSINFNTADHPCTIAPGANCYTYNSSYTSASALQALLHGSTGEPNLMNNNLKPPHSDQFTLGIRNKVGDWNTSAAISRILSKDGIEFMLGNRDLQGEFWHPDGNGGYGQPWAFAAPNTNGNLILAHNAIETRNTQVALSAEKPFNEESGWGATIAYTYTDAVQNRDINEHYVFDGPTSKTFPFITSNAAAKHRVVATATVKGPWDTMFGAKLTLATPIPFNGINYQSGHWPDWKGCCFPRALTPGGLGIRTLDLEGTKNIRIGDKVKMYVRLDALNVFNAKNLVDYNTFGDAAGVWTSVSYNPTGNITGTPRQLRLTLGAKF